MTQVQKKKLIRTNTIYWVIAMALPGVFHLGFNAFTSEGARFPWFILMPLMLVGLAVASNKMLSDAIGKPTDE